MKKKKLALIFLGLFFLVPLISFLVSAQSEPACQQIGTQQEGWYQNEQMIMNVNCTNCKAVCASAGTEQEGWYSSCDKSLIEYEACYVKCYNDGNCPTEYKIYCKDSQSCSEKISYKCENPGTALSNCVVSSPIASCIDCVYGCSDGSCKSQEIPIPQTTCIDSDGEDYYTRGYVKTESGEIWDICAGLELREGICLEGRYDRISYACLQGCIDGKCIKQETWTGLVNIEIVENICEPCPPSPPETEKETQIICRCDSTKLYNVKIQLYDSAGNLIGSGDTSKGYLEFSGLKEGRYTASLYAEGYDPDKAEIIASPNTGNYHTISLKKAGTATGDIKITVQDKITGIILTNAKVLVYDSYGNFITSTDTSAGAAVFYSLKAGAYVAIASASEYNQNKIEFKIIGGERDYLTIGLEKQATGTQPTTSTTPAIYWYRNAYWQCLDGYEEKSGGETSCKPYEVWKNYAMEACKEHCIKETVKCGVNAFKPYNECPGNTNVQPSVCGNGVCESEEGERCEIMAIACEIGKKCEAPATQSAKCYYGCEQDCRKIAEGEYIQARLNEKFKLQMSQEARFQDVHLEIKFNDLFVPTCIEKIMETAKTTQQEAATPIPATPVEEQKAVVEKYNPMTGAVITSITGMPIAGGESGGAIPSVTSISCKEAEPYAVLQIKVAEELKNQRTEVIKLQVGEKKRVFDFTVSFLDYDIQSKTVLFLVSREAFACPENCICDLAGNITECKKIEKCPEKTMLCPDGTCRNKCQMDNITTDCNFGCFYNGKCLPYGLRINKLYCSIDDNMKSQLTEDEVCDNNFECQTNVCIDGKCISAGLIQRILDWFNNLFGR